MPKISLSGLDGRAAAVCAADIEECTVKKLAIPHDAIIFVGDGRKALFLRNDGDEKFPNLKTERVFAEENPPTHEQGTDRPGTRRRERRDTSPQQRRTD